MKIQVAFVAAAIALSGTLSGCSTIGLGSGRAGTSTPASGGPTAPAAPETIISAMDGGLIGGTIGAKLKQSDRRTALQAEYRALEYTPGGKAVDWRGSGVTGSVTAAQPYRVGSQDCRQYTHTVSSGGQNQTARGTACRNADGSWTPLT
jgi:surface antigen